MSNTVFHQHPVSVWSHATKAFELRQIPHHIMYILSWCTWPNLQQSLFVIFSVNLIVNSTKSHSSLPLTDKHGGRLHNPVNITVIEATLLVDIRYNEYCTFNSTLTKCVSMWHLKCFSCVYSHWCSLISNPAIASRPAVGATSVAIDNASVPGTGPLTISTHCIRSYSNGDNDKSKEQKKCKILSSFSSSWYHCKELY